MRTPPTPVLVAAGVVVAVALGAALVVTGGDDEPPENVVAEPTATPTATPTAAATPTPTPTPTPEPFEVLVTQHETLPIVSTDNAAIVSNDSLPIDERVAADAVEIARTAFEDYLNAQFVDPDTRFGPAAIDALLAPAALAAATDDDRAALGQLDVDVAHVVTRGAEVDPMVTMHGDSPRNVTLRVAANLTLVDAGGGETPLVLRGQMIFVPTADGWLVGAADVRLVEEEAA